MFYPDFDTDQLKVFPKTFHDSVKCYVDSTKPAANILSKQSCKLWLNISEVSWSSCWTGWTFLGTRLSSQSSLWSRGASTKYWQLHNCHMDNSHYHHWSRSSTYPLIHLSSTYHPLIIHLSSTYHPLIRQCCPTTTRSTNQGVSGQKVEEYCISKKDFHHIQFDHQQHLQYWSMQKTN